MKAAVISAYGQPDVLYMKEMVEPEPKDDEVLVKVKASSVNNWDYGMLRGEPFINRVLFGLTKPKVRILGCDIVGTVEAVGKNVKQFELGDEVFGDLCESGFGAFSEYVCAPASALALKPINMSFEEAAATPQAGALGLRGVCDYVQLQKGQKVLVNGAGGGAGSFTVQIAKTFGVEVTGVDNSEKLDIMSSIGADHVIDYTKDDFTKNGKQYDLIIDHAAYHSFLDYKRSLKPGGTYIIVGGSMALVFKILVLGPLVKMTGSKNMRVQGHLANKGFHEIEKLYNEGKVRPAIDRSFPLHELGDAMRYFGEGHAKGKIVIVM